MRPKAFSFQSLATRVTIFTLSVFLISIWSLSFYIGWTLRDDMLGVLQTQQYSTASYMASDINEQLNIRLRSLEQVATSIGIAQMGDQQALQGMLDQGQVLSLLFNAGAMVLNVDGVAIADTPESAGRLGANYIDREHVAAALGQGKSSIGEPVMGKLAHAPILPMSVPIRDAQGKVIGVLTGVTNLEKPNFLDTIANHQLGVSGGYTLLVAPQYRVIVTSSDKRRIMEKVPPLGKIPAVDRFLAGYEGSAIYVNPLGVEVMASGKGIPLAGWRITITLPVATAFEPIDSMYGRLALVASVITALSALLTWWLIRRQLTPMTEAANTLLERSSSGESLQPLSIARHDEVGLLIGGFNNLLEIVREREGALHASERRANEIVQASPVPSAINDAQGNITMLNTAFVQTFGYTIEELPRLEQWWSLACPNREQRQRVVDIWQKKLEEARSAAKPFASFEMHIQCKDGRVRICIASVTPLEPDYSGSHLISLFDVTERKLMEDKVRELAFNDPLTQLPNRRLINDRLAQIMAASMRTGCFGAVMFLDLDNFKPLNDAHGHEVGDQLLIEAAGRLKSCVRGTDTVGRFGGDEFLVILSELNASSDASMTQTRIVANKILTALSEPYSLTVAHDGKPDKTIQHRCTVSIGIALFLGQKASQDEVIKWADVAMYEAKGAGRNSMRFHETRE